MSSLKPCPFCGGEAYIKTEHDADGFGVFLFVKCSHCRARSGETFSSQPCPLTYQGVRDDWNKRASPGTVAAQEVDRG